MVVAEYEHVGDETDLSCARRQVSERGKRIPVSGAAHLAGTERDGNMLATGHVVVAKTVRCFRDERDLLDAGVVLPRRMRMRTLEHDRRDDSELHFAQPKSACRLGCGVRCCALLLGGLGSRRKPRGWRCPPPGPVPAAPESRFRPLWRLCRTTCC